MYKRQKKFKAVQIGGPSGACLTEEHLDLPLDFDSLKDVYKRQADTGVWALATARQLVITARFAWPTVLRL